MPPKRTYPDANVIIAAHSARNDSFNKAIALIEDPDREFLATSLSELETLPHAARQKDQEEYEALKEFFNEVVSVRLEVSEDLVAEAKRIAQATDAGGLDAMHLAAAILMNADEFVTLEKSVRPMYRETRVKVVYLHNI